MNCKLFKLKLVYKDCFYSDEVLDRDKVKLIQNIKLIVLEKSNLNLTSEVNMFIFQTSLI